MRNKLRAIINKKASGEGAFYTGIFVMFSLMIILVFSLNIQRDFSKKEQLDTLTRKYLLLSETQGGLTDTQVANLKAEVADIVGVNVSDVSATDTTVRGTVAYGQTVKVKVTCDKADHVSSVRNFLANTAANIPFINSGTLHKATSQTGYLTIEKVSTSKY